MAQTEKSNVLTKEDFQKFIDSIPESSHLNSKMSAQDWKMLFRIMYGCALRVKESVHLKPQNFNFEDRTLSIQITKNSLEKTTILPQDVNDFKEYLKGRVPDATIWQVARQTVALKAKEFGKLAGIEISDKRRERTAKGVFTDIFRNSLARHMEIDGAPPNLIHLKKRTKPPRESPHDRTKPTIEDLKKWEYENYRRKNDNLKDPLEEITHTRLSTKITYEPFLNILKNFSGNYYKSTFEEIERILGSELPPAAYDQDRWWSNKGIYSLMKGVVNSGWKQTKINFNTREVEFERDNLTDFQKLQNYILYKMKPQANYQPVMIMTLVRMGGSLTKDTLAEQIRSNNLDNPDQDYKQIPVYEVLTKNEIVRQEGIHYVLNGYHDFTDEQKQEITELCEQKIKEFNSKNFGENLDEVSESNEENNIAKKFIDNQDFAKFLNAVPMTSPFQSTTGRPPILAENYQILYRILYGTALKLDDALNLKVRDLDLENREISVVDSESNGYTATILPCDVSHLKQHIAKLKENDPLFDVDRQSVWTYAKMVGIRAGLIISVKKGETTREGVSPSLFRESRARQMWLDGADEDLINLKLRRQFTNTEYKDSPPTIEELKKWESKKYPFDYSENDATLTFMSNELKFPLDLEKRIQAARKRIAVNEEVLKDILAEIMGGNHLILYGPPGTGKTELAKLIPKIFFDNNPELDSKEDYCDIVTANADWTTYDVIGGQKKIDNRFVTYKGCVVKAIEKGSNEKGHWLVIDEFNRADIDKAFGAMFTAIEHGKIYHQWLYPESDIEEGYISIPHNFRIIATMNSFDKNLLYTISYGLARRLAFVEIPIPPKEDEVRILNTKVEEKISVEKENLKKVLESESYENKKTELLEVIYKIRGEGVNIGTAQIINTLSSFASRMILEPSENNNKMIDRAFASNIIQMLEGQTDVMINKIIDFIPWEFSKSKLSALRDSNLRL